MSGNLNNSALKKMLKNTKITTKKINHGGFKNSEPMQTSVTHKAPKALPKKTSAWIDHVKHYAATHNVTYKEAMTQSKSSYKK